MQESTKTEHVDRPVVRVKNLRKVYGTHTALEDVSFEVRPGEIVGLLGLNGAGKSTILKILGAMLTPTSGIVEVGGYSVEDCPYEVRQMLGYLPDEPPLYDEMTVRNYLGFVAGVKGMSKRSVPEAVEEAITQTNLGDVADKILGALSHGYRQRVGIAQAIVHHPKIVILDEPINGLDPLQIVEMRDLINSLRTKHTVLLSSHILSEITRTCDRILIIDRGRVSAQGSETELRNRIQSHMTITVELAGKHDRESIEAVSETLKSLPSVTSIETDQRWLKIQTTEDSRPEIARAIVQSGYDLAGLSRLDGGLESLFVKLIQTDTDTSKTFTPMESRGTHPDA